MSITYQMFQKASFYLEKYDRETFLADTGQRSRAIIPGDDPVDQQPPELRGFYPDPRRFPSTRRRRETGPEEAHSRFPRIPARAG